MAKRKRLTPAALTGAESASEGATGAPLETKATNPFGVAPAPTHAPTKRAPIAQVAGEASAQAALNEVAAELDAARNEGRLVQALSLDSVLADHLHRDRMVSDADEMAALKGSLKARGQQTPIEVVVLEGGGYGLISGWRRLQALQALHEETGDQRFAKVQALIKQPATVSDSYVAMVEENEIRADLSFYERARLACEAAKLGVYGTAAEAVSVLFAHAPPAKRSKIKSFIRIHEELGDVLRFPVAIPEKAGLALTQLLEREPARAAALKAALRDGEPADAVAERAVLDAALRGAAPKGAKPKAKPREVIPGVALECRRNRVVLSGSGVTPALQEALQSWLTKQ